ncbi:EF-hand domain-containing protein [Methylobrevis pamukkalensis]|uniref:EF hand n=1 Tax=Methylobrevis pamukkalensis TaxID=1439726 RepID=A0A1E3GXK8_9HYPH|nr:EF-hand domain-containing protein [Methylobrevis pamukkalensis]ODN68798.1 EF hand [Methylobrevis pamukkalensis]
MKTATKAIAATLAAVLALGTAGAAFADGRWERHGMSEGRGPHGGPHGGPHHGPHGPHGKMGAEQLMKRFDADKDGRITKEEIAAVQDRRFSEAAPSGDSISLDLYKQFWLKEHDLKVVRDFQRLDRNGDGQISKEEFNRRTDRMMERLDRDGDGVLTRVDRPRGDHRKGDGEHRKGPRGERGERDGERGPRGERGERGGERGPGPMMQQGDAPDAPPADAPADAE